MTVTAVLGCGTIGASWAQAFLAAGCSVRLWDPAAAAVEALAARLGAGALPCASAAEAVAGVDFIQESGPERLELKRALLAEIAAAVAAQAVFASSTSTLMASDLQAGSGFAGRILVGHPFNPPHLIPLVEVVGGRLTDADAIDAAMAFYARIGKHPIRLNTERPGHLANRLQAAIWREAVDAVASGQASVADVDAAISEALGPRWALQGQFGVFDLGGGTGGLAHFIAHLGRPFEALWDDAQRPQMTPELVATLTAGAEALRAGRTTAEVAAARNAKLAAILAIKTASDDS